MWISLYNAIVVILPLVCSYIYMIVKFTFKIIFLRRALACDDNQELTHSLRFSTMAKLSCMDR